MSETKMQAQYYNAVEPDSEGTVRVEVDPPMPEYFLVGDDVRLRDRDMTIIIDSISPDRKSFTGHEFKIRNP